MDALYSVVYKTQAERAREIEDLGLHALKKHRSRYTRTTFSCRCINTRTIQNAEQQRLFWEIAKEEGLEYKHAQRELRAWCNTKGRESNPGGGNSATPLPFEILHCPQLSLAQSDADEFTGSHYGKIGGESVVCT